MTDDEDPHQVNIMYDWFTYSVSQAPPDAINSKEKRKWDIEYIEPYGRCMIAVRDIEEGEVLFVDHPIVTGPKQYCGVMCLGCYKQLQSWDEYHCSKCGWPVCGPKCETMGYHPMECKFFADAGYKPCLNDFTEEQFSYEAFLPLRSYCLRTFEPDKWKTLMAMESHDEERKGTELFEREDANIVDFLRKKVKVPIDADLLHTITGILDVNCHEVRSNIPGTKDEYRVRGVYPLTAMMSHFCSNNTHHTLTDNMIMIVMASRPIKKGEQVTATYTHTLCATAERRKHLKFGKFFDCVCDRCRDPTEMGTYFGALRCSQPGCGGNILCTDPICVTNDAPWKCDHCRYQVQVKIKITSESVERLNEMVYWELQQVPEEDISAMESIFKKYQFVFHPQHFHLIGLKHSLSQLYGRMTGYLLPELSEASMLRKIECCQDLLKVYEVLDPGISRLRGLTLYELHAPILLQAKKAFQSNSISRKDFLDRLHEAEGYLSTTIYCLQCEPESTFEGKICKVAKNYLKELQTWIVSVQTLPAKHFLPEKEEEKTQLVSLSEEDLTLENLLQKLEER